MKIVTCLSSHNHLKTKVRILVGKKESSKLVSGPQKQKGGLLLLPLRGHMDMGTHASAGHAAAGNAPATCTGRGRDWTCNHQPVKSYLLS